MRFARADQRPRQRHRQRVAGRGKLLDRGTAGIGQPEQLGGLVERLARRIVDRRRQAAVIAHAAHLEQLAVAAGDEQQQVGKLQVGIDQPRRQRMTLEMVHRDQRLAGG